jgi:hypothetical protein
MGDHPCCRSYGRLSGTEKPDRDGIMRRYEGRYVVLGSLDESCVKNARIIRIRDTGLA